MTEWLLTRTRDTKRFSILFRENVSFGFRRNLWGLKPTGIVVSFLAGVGSVAAIIHHHHVADQTPSPEVVLVTAAVWPLLLVWLALITRSWVRIPADAFGRQVLAACDTLGLPEAPTRRTNTRRAGASKATPS